MPIIVAPLDTPLRIVRICAEAKIKKHLESLGLTIDETIRLLSREGKNIILLIKNSRLALDENIATKIFVM